MSGGADANCPPKFSKNTAQDSQKHAISSEKFIFFWEGLWLSVAVGRRLWMTMINSEYFQLAGTLEVGAVRREVQTRNSPFTVDDVYQRSSDCNVNVSL